MTGVQTCALPIYIEVKIKAKNGQAHPVIREKDLERHLGNEQKPEEKNEEKKKELAPITVDEKDDVQLKRAIDLLKSWRVFKENPLESK